MGLFTADTTYAYIRPRRRLPSIAATNTGTLTATLAELVGDIDGTATSSAALAATMPELIGDIDAVGTANGVLAGTFPQLTSDVDGTASSAAVLGASLAELTAALSVTGSDAGVLAGTLSQLAADIDGSVQNSGSLSLLFPDMLGDIDGSGTASGGLGATLSQFGFALVGSVETEGAVFAAALPEMSAEFDGTSSGIAAFVASLPTLLADVDGTVADSPVAVLDATLAELVAGFDVAQLAEAALGAKMPELQWNGTGEFETNADGELMIVLPTFIAGRTARRLYKMDESQRRLTREFIASSPVYLELIPGSETRLPSGGVSVADGVPRPTQMFRLIPMSHTEQPARSTSASASADAGVQRRYDYTLLGEWDAVMRVKDHWYTEDGQQLVIENMVSYNGYERKGLVISYGVGPSHVAP